MASGRDGEQGNRGDRYDPTSRGHRERRPLERYHRETSGSFGFGIVEGESRCLTPRQSKTDAKGRALVNKGTSPENSPFDSSLHAAMAEGRENVANCRNSLKSRRARTNPRFVERCIGRCKPKDPQNPNPAGPAGIQTQGGGILVGQASACRRLVEKPQAEACPTRRVASLAWNITEIGKHACRPTTPRGSSPSGKPTGTAQDLPHARPRPRQAQALHPRHVPLPQRRGPARRPPRRLHGHRHPLPLQADERDSTSCTRWAGTPSACPPNSTPSRPARTPARPPARTSTLSAGRSSRSASPTTGTARSTRPTPTITNGPSGSS